MKHFTPAGTSTDPLMVKLHELQIVDHETSVLYCRIDDIEGGTVAPTDPGELARLRRAHTRKKRRYFALRAEVAEAHPACPYAHLAKLAYFFGTMADGSDLNPGENQMLRAAMNGLPGVEDWSPYIAPRLVAKVVAFIREAEHEEFAA